MQTSVPTFQETRNYLGDILYLVAVSEFHHHWKMHQVKRVFVPPVHYKQYRIWYSNNNPVGACIWAWVSDEVLEKLKTDSYKIQHDDWQSGKHLWVAEFISPFGQTRQMVRNMRQFVRKNYGKKVKGQWYRPSKKKVGFAVS